MRRAVPIGGQGQSKDARSQPLDLKPITELVFQFPGPSQWRQAFPPGESLKSSKLHSELS